jgi:hypothetical protein
MRSRLALLVCVFALTLPAAADRLLLPPLETAGAGFFHTASDGMNHLGIVYAPDAPFTFTLLMNEHGAALGPLMPLPLESVQTVTWAGHYIVFSRNSFVRVANDGTLIDRQPRALPFTLAESERDTVVVSNGERVLVRGASEFHFLEPDGETRPVPLPFSASAVGSYATDGDRFVLVRTRDSFAAFTTISRRGDAIAHRDSPLPLPISRPILVSDGHTWAIFARDGEPHFHLFDRDLQYVTSNWNAEIATTHAVAVPGGGYVAATESKSYKTPVTSDWYFAEFSPPSYRSIRKGQATWLSTLTSNGRSIVTTGGGGLRIVPTIAAWETTTPVPYPGIPSGRREMIAATNGDGLALALWFGAASRVARDETVLDPQRLAVPWACWSRWGFEGWARPSIVTDGRDFVIASVCDGKLRTGIVRATGEVVAAPYLHHAAHNGVSLVFDGTNTILFWTVREHVPQVMASVLDADGRIASTRRLREGKVVAAAATRDGFLFLYTDGPASHDQEAVYAETLERTLVPGPISARISIGPGRRFQHELIPAGDYFLFARGVARSSVKIEVLTLAATGRVADSIAITPDTLLDFLPHCDGPSCTFLVQRGIAPERTAIEGLRIAIAADGTMSVSEPVRLVEAGAPHEQFLLPFFFRGTLEKPRLWYGKYAETLGAADVHVLGGMRSRAVRH